MPAGNDRPWPLLVEMGGGYPAAALMNRKAYRKSLEDGFPWVVHPVTGRVLPWPGKPRFTALSEGSGRYDLRLPAGSDPHPYGENLPPQVNPDDREPMNEGAGDDTGGYPAATGDHPGVNPAPSGTGILERLSALMAERRRQMPEGSYTTHLFGEGADRIRKKLGEEAVELILARSDPDIIYEGADLVFHLMVLLEALNLSWTDIETELERRHSAG